VLFGALALLLEEAHNLLLACKRVFLLVVGSPENKKQINIMNYLLAMKTSR
jgi:hypothetical protein